MSTKTYVVTGDRGFVGSKLVDELNKRGNRVIGVDIVSPNRNDSTLYQAVTMDLSERTKVMDFFGCLDVIHGVFHLAAKLPTSDEDPLGGHLLANLRPTENILESLDGRDVPLVLSSTMSVYGLPPHGLPVNENTLPSPIEPYGLCKLAGEYAAQRMALAGRVPAVVLRYSGIFGEGYAYGAIHLYASRLFVGKPVDIYASGRLIRDYVHVSDVVQANLLAAEYARKKPWGLFHIGGGEPRPLIEIAKLVRDAFGTGEIKVNNRPGTFDFGLDIRAARDGLGYSPSPLRDRIQQYVDALKGSIGG